MSERLAAAVIPVTAPGNEDGAYHSEEPSDPDGIPPL
jgi:hypothetical protein